MTPPTYFLSYSRKDVSDIRSIARVLMIHGIRIWQDIEHLGAGISEERVRQAIREESDGLLFLATTNSMSSEFIRTVELPEAERRVKRSEFNIIPIFGLPIGDVTSGMKDCLTVPISNFNGVDVTTTGGSTGDMMLVGERAAEIILTNLTIDTSEPFRIGLASKRVISEDVSLALDYGSFVKDGRLPQEYWHNWFHPGLVRVRDALLSRNIVSLRLYPFCHLSLGFMFGNVFSGTGGHKLGVRQLTRNETKIWSTTRTLGGNPLRVAELPGVIGSRDLCVKVNLMSSDDSSVIRYLDGCGIRPRATVEYYPDEYPLLISGNEAVAIAADLVSKIKEMNARYDTRMVYLFAAIPIGLAVIIGHNINACGTIQCHEFDNGRREYYPSCRLT